MYLILLVFLADVYIFVSWLKPLMILNYALLIVFFLKTEPAVFRPFRNLLLAFYTFFLFLFLVNLIQNTSREAFSLLASAAPLPLLFVAFASRSNGSELVFYYAKLYVLYNLAFSLLQLFGFHVTAGQLLANVPFVYVDNNFTGNIGGQGLRVSGASYSTISFACHIGLIFILFYYTKSRPNLVSAVERAGYLFLLLSLGLLSQTRSLLFMIPVVLFFVNLFYSSVNRSRKIFTTLIGGVVFLATIYLSVPLIELFFPRLLLDMEQDGSVVHRIQANVYAVVGTLYMSFLTGVPFEDALEAMRIGYSKVGMFIGYYFIDVVTHHNQPAFFFRYYGFIGLTLFFLVYWRLLQLGKLVGARESDTKMIVAMVGFQFLFSLSHNNKITTDYFLWIFLAMNMYAIINSKRGVYMSHKDGLSGSKSENSTRASFRG